MCAEVRHEVLVKNLKDELCKVRFEQQKEAHFEVEEVEDKMYKYFRLDVKEEYFDESRLESTLDEEK